MSSTRYTLSLLQRHPSRPILTYPLQVKDIMVHNVEQILSRGERIELLVDKTDHLCVLSPEPFIHSVSADASPMQVRPGYRVPSRSTPN